MPSIQIFRTNGKKPIATTVQLAMQLLDHRGALFPAQIINSCSDVLQYCGGSPPKGTRTLDHTRVIDPTRTSTHSNIGTNPISSEGPR